jgi:hypothetical protein
MANLPPSCPMFHVKPPPLAASARAGGISTRWRHQHALAASASQRPAKVRVRATDRPAGDDQSTNYPCDRDPANTTAPVVRTFDPDGSRAI